MTGVPGVDRCTKIHRCTSSRQVIKLHGCNINIQVCQIIQMY